MTKELSLHKIYLVLAKLEKKESQILMNVKTNHPLLVEEVMEIFSQCRRLYQIAKEI